MALTKKSLKEWQSKADHVGRLIHLISESLSNISPDSEVSLDEKKRELERTIIRLWNASVSLNHIGKIHGLDLTKVVDDWRSGRTLFPN